MAVLGMTAAPASAQPIEIGHIPECLELVPAAIAVPPGSPVGLDVRVLLDGVAPARGAEIFNLVSQSYGPVGMPVNATFQSVTFSGTDAQGLIDQSKALFGGVRPAGTDVVYTLTSKDITAAGNPAVAGLADCIGGVAFPDRAFAVGEELDPDSSELGGLVLAANLSAKVAAHEVGHLFGGHHHYANCVEGLLSELGAELSPCTLMFNAVDLSSFPFSVVNSLVVRGHAEAYAAG
ncbi:MAG: zinc-dependent metalloprotease family protein [Thermoleophilaceae bacterium]